MDEHPLSIGKTYCLHLPDGRALGHVRIERLDDPWAEGPFRAAPAFAEFRALFERADELPRGQVIPLWEEAADALEALQIQVVEEEGGARHGGLRVFVVGDQACIAPPLRLS